MSKRRFSTFSDTPDYYSSFQKNKKKYVKTTGVLEEIPITEYENLQKNKEYLIIEKDYQGEFIEYYGTFKEKRGEVLIFGNIKPSDKDDIFNVLAADKRLTISHDNPTFSIYNITLPFLPDDVNKHIREFTGGRKKRTLKKTKRSRKSRKQRSN